MNYIRQIIYELKNQKMVTWVAISGTALAIFLIMAIFMADRLQSIVMPPESNRERILKGQGMDVVHDLGSASGMHLNYDLAKKLYENLDGVDKVSYVTSPWGAADLNLPNEKTISAEEFKVDDRYWQMYDYKFISGKPFEKEEIEAGQYLAILTESTARKLFGETDVAGRQIDINNIPYTVKGVVEDSYPLLPDGTIEVFTNFTDFKENNDSWMPEFFGATMVRLLIKEGIDPNYIKLQVEKRYEDMNRELKESGRSIIYHQQPYTSEELSAGSFGSNNGPNLKVKTRLRAVIYVILLLLPAINLSSMTRSRLRNRISEIGVRRAFGAKKKSIISQIFTENLLMTFVGGAIGLCLSLIFLALLSGYFIIFNNPNTFDAIAPVSAAPVIWHVFDFSAFFIAFGACFVLNALSATLPAWKASGVEPAIAISKAR